MTLSPHHHLACPACGKDNVLTPETTACGRCRADLAPLWQIVLAARGLLARAAEAVRAGDPETALALATRSWSLFPDPHAAHTAALAAAARHDLPALLHWRRRASGASTGRASNSVDSF